MDNRDLDRLGRDLDRLKREYDLHLAGRSRVPPNALRERIEREILRLTRFPFPTTAQSFRLKSLAHRFRALDAQVHNLIELRSARRKREEVKEAPQQKDHQEAVPADERRDSVVLNGATLADPERVRREISGMCANLVRPGNGGAPVDPETLARRLTDEARKHLDRPGVRAVRYRLVDDGGGAKIRGEIVTGPEGGSK